MSDLDTPFYDSYQSYEGINSFGDALVDHFDGVLEGFDVGVTYGGRTIRGWRAHIAPEEGEAEAMERKKKKGRKGEGEVIPEQKLEFVVQSGQHAREVSSFPHFRLPRAKGDMRCGKANIGTVGRTSHIILLSPLSFTGSYHPPSL